MKGALIGAGFFAQFQAEAWMRMPDVNLVAVADLDADRVREFADRYGIAQAYCEVGEMLDRERPDFIDIATRPESHFELAELAAARGIHVICQKPLAPTWDESAALVQACEHAGVRLLVHENWRWQPWYRVAKRLLDEGIIGPLQAIDYRWQTGDGVGPQPYAAQPYFRLMPRLLIFESLVHILDTYRYFGGEMQVVACQTQRFNPVIAGEDWARIEIAFDSGAAGCILGDRLSGPVPAPVAMGEMRIVGEQGTLRVAADGNLFLIDASGGQRQLDFTPQTVGYKGDSVLATQQHLIAALRAGLASESDGRDYLNTVKLVETAYELAALSGANSTKP